MGRELVTKGFARCKDLAVGELQGMPLITVDPSDLKPFGDRWTVNGGSLSRTPPQSSGQLGRLFDAGIAKSLATMLGDIPIALASATRLGPTQADCVELGEIRTVGGVRPQNFDVGYRPDGVRFVSDTKTLNDAKSVGKNYQNMINDLGTEAVTVHTRFPYAVVAFVVVIPDPCLAQPQRSAIMGALERLGRREKGTDPAHLAEAISLVLWDPQTGEIIPDSPSPTDVNQSILRLENFSRRIEDAYFNRYAGMPPHV
jgi:hypothetical protein